ncbi:MAG: hypothetical protein KDD70_08675 [Bdellovibrionales bacterium]|nr:hypothetical protein [Bdellovibrionales bacterium]
MKTNFDNSRVSFALDTFKLVSITTVIVLILGRSAMCDSSPLVWPIPVPCDDVGQVDEEGKSETPWVKSTTGFLTYRDCWNSYPRFPGDPLPGIWYRRGNRVFEDSESDAKLCLQHMGPTARTLACQQADPTLATSACTEATRLAKKDCRKRLREDKNPKDSFTCSRALLPPEHECSFPDSKGCEQEEPARSTSYRAFTTEAANLDVEILKLPNGDFRLVCKAKCKAGAFCSVAVSCSGCESELPN